jgi:hypothetical protein
MKNLKQKIVNLKNNIIERYCYGEQIKKPKNMKKSFEAFLVIAGLLIGSMIACWANNHIEEPVNTTPLYLNCVNDLIYDGTNYTIEYSDPDVFENDIVIIANPTMFYAFLTDYKAYEEGTYIVESPIYGIEETIQGYHLTIME